MQYDTDRCEMGMALNVGFAGTKDEESLAEILAGHQMGLVGEPEEHVVLRGADGSILGGAMLSCWDGMCYHLEVFGIRAGENGQGLGSTLITPMMENPRKFCRRFYGEEGVEEDEVVHMTTVSRGSARPFYERHGFEPCTFEQLPELYLNQCSTCPDREACEPVPMLRQYSANFG